jgi:tetratricopeptide (TPR) repeat protein
VAFDRDKVLQEAQKLVAKGRLDRAVVEYQKLVKANPGDDRAMLKIAELQTRMRAYEAAVSTYEQVASYYASEGFFAKATAIYKQIRSLIQQHLPESKGHYGPIVDKLAQLYIDAGLKGDAIATYQEYATHLQRAGRETELLPIYRRIVELKEDDLDARRKLIEMLRAHSKDQEADDHLVTYGERLVFLGRVDEGLLALDDVARRRNTDAGLARRVADLYLDRNGPGDAMLALTRMQACFLSTKRDIDTLRVLARAFSAIGQRPKAVEVRKLMVKIAKDNGDLEIAQALVDELLEDCPRDPEIQTLAASVYPDRAPPVPMPEDDAPEVEAAPASVSFSEESFEFIEESINELGDEMEAAASSRPPSLSPFGSEKLYRPVVPPAPPIPRPGFPPLSAAPVRPPLAPPPRGLAPPPPPKRSVEPNALRPLPPPPRPVGSKRFSPFPSQGPDLGDLADAYDDLDGGDSLADDEEETTLSRRAKAAPGSLPPPDFFADDDGGPDALDDAVFGGTPPVVQPTYEVDDGLEEALEEADFFVAQGLFDDALTLLQDLIPRYPGHPLLIERMQSVRAAKRASGE